MLLPFLCFKPKGSYHFPRFPYQFYFLVKNTNVFETMDSPPFRPSLRGEQFRVSDGLYSGLATLQQSLVCLSLQTVDREYSLWDSSYPYDLKSRVGA